MRRETFQRRQTAPVPLLIKMMMMMYLLLPRLCLLRARLQLLTYSLWHLRSQTSIRTLLHKQPAVAGLLWVFSSARFWFWCAAGAADSNVSRVRCEYLHAGFICVSAERQPRCKDQRSANQTGCWRSAETLTRCSHNVNKRLNINRRHRQKEAGVLKTQLQCFSRIRRRDRHYQPDGVCRADPRSESSGILQSPKAHVGLNITGVFKQHSPVLQHNHNLTFLRGVVVVAAAAEPPC